MISPNSLNNRFCTYSRKETILLVLLRFTTLTLILEITAFSLLQRMMMEREYIVAKYNLDIQYSEWLFTISIYQGLLLLALCQSRYHGGKTKTTPAPTLGNNGSDTNISLNTKLSSGAKETHKGQKTKREDPRVFLSYLSSMQHTASWISPRDCQLSIMQNASALTQSLPS